MRYEVTKEDKQAEKEEKKKPDGIMRTDVKAIDRQAEKEEEPEKRKFSKTKKEIAKKKAKGLKKMANKIDYKVD